MASYTSTVGSYTATLAVSETATDPTNNKSTVTYSLTLTKWNDNSTGVWNYTYDANWYIKLDGTTVASGNFSYDFRNYKTLTLKGNTTMSITHDANGAKSVPVQGYVFMSNQYVSSPLNATGTLALTDYKIVSYNMNGSSATAPASQITATSVTLPAAQSNWSGGVQRTTYTVSYNLNGGTSSTPGNQSAYKDVAHTNVFNGWHEGSASGTNHSASSSFTPSGDIVMYAGWTDSTSTTNSPITTAAAPTKASSNDHNGGSAITTSYNANGGSSTPSSQTSYQQYKTVYTFNKWHVNSESGTAVDASTSYMPTANVTLWAKWTATETAQSGVYGTITLANAITKSSSSSTTNLTITFNYGDGSGSTPSLTSTTTTTTTYSFNGWHEGSATGTSHGAGTSWAPSSSKTLYAGWDTSTATTQPTSITLPAATAPANQVFDGWYTASTGGNYVGTNGSTYTPTASTTLYARYVSSSVAAPAAIGIYIKTESGWKEINDFAKVKTATDTWKGYVDNKEDL